MNVLQNTALAAIAFVAFCSCGGQPGGTCTLPGGAPTVAGTPIPTQPIPASTGITTPVTVLVGVTVDASGNLSSITIKASSNNFTLDNAALTLVKGSKFNPGFAGCGSVPNQATISILFSPSA